MYYDRKTFTDEELIVRIWDKECIKDLISRRAFYYANNRRADELKDLWVTEAERRRTASFGGNTGFYVGMEEIEKWYVTQAKAAWFDRLRPYADSGIAVLDEKDLGFGAMAFHTANTPLIYIAEDGQTARGMWSCEGQETYGAPDGGHAYFVQAVLAGDFVREDEGWKIWHLVICNDLFVEAGQDFGNQPISVPPEEDPIESQFGSPTIRKAVHNSKFNWADDYPTMPLPYDTYRDEEGYGPEGFRRFEEARL